MAVRSIPQRELRNNIGAILREVEAGTEFTITVRGRPVARLGPADQHQAPRVDVDAGSVRTMLFETPVDGRFRSDIDEMRLHEEPVDAPSEYR
jgi:prevent-host-death family protein